MAKLWHPNNRPDTSEGAGEGGVEAEADERGRKQVDEEADLPP